MANDEVMIKQYLSKYKHPDYASREVISLLQRFRSLNCRLEKFVFNNGSTKDLLNMEGTIPVQYKGTVYNIPVCIWVMDTHPQNVPLCFVKPTPDMLIKVSKYVDRNGKVYLPYLHNWMPNSSSLLNLVMAMITAFGEIPPVYNKRYDGNYTPVDPFNNRPQVNMPGTFEQMYNPGPEYPTAQPGYPMPGLPAMPTPAIPYPGYGTPYPSYNTTQAPYPTTSTPYPPVVAGNQQDAATSGGTITEVHIKASLLSAVEDKLRRRLKEQAQQSSAELDTLRRTQQELGEGQKRLDDIIAKLQRENADLDKNLAILKEKEEELAATVERIAEQDKIDVDEAIITTAPIYSQLLNAFAEEATLEDALYFMGEALRKEVIDLDTFLKQIRTLARRQFSLRALMHKCRQKAQLAC